ncbi:MAG: PD-(D/E)XK nuclease family protein [Elusimicrobia bacterium]|nr:PD-(D/E)XK nuclease family protein [Elusimicrobiota bacterium]
MDLPRPLSHSAISMYVECPKRWWFRYVEKVPEKPRHFFSFGRSMHSAVEFFYGVPCPPPPSVEELLRAYKSEWVSEGYRDKAQEATYFEEGKAILIAFYHKHAKDFAVPLKVEHEFSAVVEGVPVTGKIDRVDELPDGRLAILDYKTGKELARNRAADDPQLTMYQLGCELEFGREVGRVAFYHLPTLEVQESGRHAASKVESLKRRISETARSIMNDRFDPAPEERKCLWCDYKPLCPVFRHQFPVSLAVAEEAAQAPEPDGDEKLSGLVDRYGEALARAAALDLELGELRSSIAELFRKKGYSRAFGRKFEAVVTRSERWEFRDKKKVLDLIKTAGLYETILAPSAPLVQKLMRDPGLDPGHRAKLEAAAELTEFSEVKVSPVVPVPPPAPEPGGALPLFGKPAKKR